MKTIILAAGGTGGHIFPARALCQELEKAGYEVILITDIRGKKYNITEKTYVIQSSSPSGNLLNKLCALVDLSLGYLQARKLLMKFKPDIVVGFGGYPSFPTMYAAVNMGFKTVIHEQNSLLGRVNKMLAKKVDVIATSFPKIKGVEQLYDDKIKMVGNPVRQEIKDLYSSKYIGANDKSQINILILGGSQGASIFAEVVPYAIKLLDKKLRDRLVIHQQCRANDIDATQKFYAEMGLSANLAVFFDDVAELLSQTNLVIARAGASTIAEITIAGRPAILVPYPHAMDNHQAVNAQNIIDAKGGWMMLQDDFTADILAQKLTEIFSDNDILPQAAQNIKLCAMPNAAKNLAKVIASL